MSHGTNIQCMTFLHQIVIKIYWFVLRFYGTINTTGSCQMWSVLPNDMFTGQA